MPPTIEIDQDPAQIFRGDEVQFTARVSDDQADGLAIKWARVAGACADDPADHGTWPLDKLAVGKKTFTVDGPLTTVPFCVWAVVVDQYGAASADNRSVTPANHAPTAQIKIISPTRAAAYPFMSAFRVQGVVADVDADDVAGLTPVWALTAPPGSNAQLGPCLDTATSKLVQCFSSDLPGDYRIDLTITDDAAASGTASVAVTVLPDRLPCIVSVSPDPGASPLVHVRGLPGDPDPDGAPDRFSVLMVDDDLDSYPGNGASQLHFDWSVKSRDTGPFASQGPQGATFTLPASGFRAGEAARVRVEIADRNNAAAIENILSACNEDACVVNTATQNGCRLRVTWTVEY